MSHFTEKMEALATSGTDNMSAIQMIWKERYEQIYKHRRSVEDDSKYTQDELLDAAIACIDNNKSGWPSNWDKNIRERIFAKPEQERLAIGAAFVAAHIDAMKYNELLERLSSS